MKRPRLAGACELQPGADSGPGGGGGEACALAHRAARRARRGREHMHGLRGAAVRAGLHVLGQRDGIHEVIRRHLPLEVRVARSRGAQAAAAEGVDCPAARGIRGG